VIYTGQHMPLTEIYDNDNMPYIRPLDPALGTLGSMLRTAGYYCAYQGKWHLSRAYRDPNDPRPATDALEPYGFSEFNDWGDLDGGAWAGLKIDPVIAGQAVKWLRNRAPMVAREQPWFLTVNFVNPHDVMSHDYGGRRLVAPPPNLAKAMVVRPPADVPLYSKVWDLDVPATVSDDLSGAAPAVQEYAKAMETMFGPVQDDTAWRLGVNFYLNCTRDVDRSIDVVLDALIASGQADRTVVIFTSDHGEMAGSHGLRQKGNLVYDENFHVPFVVCHPDLRVGSHTDALGSAIDLAPTLLDIAGVDAATVAERFPNFRGRSLLPALTGQHVRDGVLTAVEIVTTLDDDFWRSLGDPDGPERVFRPAPCVRTGPSEAFCAATPTTGTPSAATSPRLNRTDHAPSNGYSPTTTWCFTTGRPTHTNRSTSPMTPPNTTLSLNCQRGSKRSSTPRSDPTHGPGYPNDPA
jgi:arylsulfatase A-like enzyme